MKSSILIRNDIDVIQAIVNKMHPPVVVMYPNIRKIIKRAKKLIHK